MIFVDSQDHKYVSTRKRGTHGIVPKLCGRTLRGQQLRGAQIEGSKTLWGKITFNLFPAEFWTTQSVPCKFLDPLKCARQSFGAMQCFLMETQLWGININLQSSKKNYLSKFLSLFFCHCHFKDLYNQYKNSSWNGTFKKILLVVKNDFRSLLPFHCRKK